MRCDLLLDLYHLVKFAKKDFFIFLKKTEKRLLRNSNQFDLRNSNYFDRQLRKKYKKNNKIQYGCRLAFINPHDLIKMFVNWGFLSFDLSL